jgi:hypothetical protein
MRIKPVRKSGSVPALQEITGRGLTRFADDLLLSGATVVSEGAVSREGPGEDAIYSGSTMVTIELDGRSVSGMESPSMREALRESVRHSISFCVKLMRIARSEAERRCAPFLPRGMRTELEFTIDGSALLVDIEIECPLAEPQLHVDDGAEASP